ncbi:MAG: VOC family protein [Rhodospirillaceae bacterium]
MFGHITVGTNDLARAARCYDTVLATLGHGRFMESAGRFVGYGNAQGGHFFVMTPFDGRSATVGNGVHVAFLAPSRAGVDAFHAAALAAGGTDEGAPGLRPRYHEHYYGAYVRDPDGNKLQAVRYQPE